MVLPRMKRLPRLGTLEPLLRTRLGSETLLEVKRAPMGGRDAVCVTSPDAGDLAIGAVAVCGAICGMSVFDVEAQYHARRLIAALTEHRLTPEELGSDDTLPGNHRGQA